MNSWNCSLVTVWASIWKGCSWTSRTGSSASAFHVSGPLEPMRKVPPGSSIIGVFFDMVGLKF